MSYEPCIYRPTRKDASEDGRGELGSAARSCKLHGIDGDERTYIPVEGTSQETFDEYHTKLAQRRGQDHRSVHKLDLCNGFANPRNTPYLFEKHP